MLERILHGNKGVHFVFLLVKNLDQTIENNKNLLTWQLAKVGGRATVEHVDAALDLVERGGRGPGGTEAGFAASHRRTHATAAARNYLKKTQK